jgi:Domain of unknown function (DUF4349)
MHRRHLVLLLASVVLSTAGCRNLAKRPDMFLNATAPAMGLYSRVQAAEPQRYIAESQKVDLVVSEQELEKSWEALVAYCGTIRCEVVSSSITAKAADVTPSGTISLRVAPEGVNALFAEVQNLGKITQHTTQREDKTTAVIDSDAKIKNLISFRDSLRNMLAKPSATVNDLVAIQQQLMETQSQLDSETAQGKSLANDTEKIFIDFSLRASGSNEGISSWRRIGNAFRESGAILADSTAAVITTVVAIVPWLILILPCMWLAPKIWRRFRRNRAIAPPVPTVAS